MQLNERITALRKGLGLSQEAFAEKLGVSRQAVSKWESGASVPELEKIARISKLCGVSTDDLIHGTDVPASEEPTAALPTEGPAPVCAEEADPDDVVTVGSLEDIPIPDTPEEKKKKHLSKRILALVLAVCVLLSGTLLTLHHFGKLPWQAKQAVKYPFILIHGLGGWGDKEDGEDAHPYWGATTGDLVEKLRSEGYEVFAPSVGPVSSTWDRTCELYAQLTGTTVDYGEAHAKAHGHARYGRSYDTPLVPDWGEPRFGTRVKVNLVGHSFGGATARMLTWLLANGSADEQAATGDATSPLFTGGKADWVNSVTTLCAPHNGSSLSCVLNDLGGILRIKDTTQLLAYLCFTVAGMIAPIEDDYDFMLDQFGITADQISEAGMRTVISALRSKGTDNAGYDLTPDGARALNERIGLVDDVYYFSYSFCTTREGLLLGGQLPVNTTLPILFPLSAAMGQYTGKTDGGIEINAAWQPNDGLVNVISARCPAGEAHQDFPDDGSYQRGVWYVADTLAGDHGTVIGLNADADRTMDFWTTLCSTIDGLKR